MGVFAILFSRLSRAFFAFLGLFGRLLCCGRRRRRNSDTLLPFTAVLYKTSDNLQQFPSSDGDLQSWAWEDGQPISVSVISDDNSGQYADGRINEDQEEQIIDYFQDMVPEIKKPTKILVKKATDAKTDDATMSARLSMDFHTTPLNAHGAELGVWDDAAGTWEEASDSELPWDTSAVIKEKRLMERDRRAAENLRKKQEKDAIRLSKKEHLATKLS